ncbi:CARDB domain-containing protein [Myxococcus qinghaiensis]|uniref:CARDB domain-containing protein n=1 Tax=Myxococcus qinghaiensis TaxID=2906758 RepID=UPI0020A7855A|nr:CARDB domain-containing protein [Myxococcus qinghaiensis]MCP3168510.1 hypothetical protein [Myxococcus qinghaiensis]
MTASVTVCNQGTDYSPQTQAQLYVSMDDELTPMGLGGPGYPVTDQAPLGMVQVPDLFPGRCATVSTNFWPTLPPDAQNVHGAYYVGAIIDEQSSVQELREDNNVFIHGLVGVGDGPDLVITAMSIPTSVAPSQAFTLSARACNQGTQPSGPTEAQLYLSIDTALTPTWTSPSFPLRDQTLIGQVSVSALAPGQCEAVSTTATATLPPDAQGDGVYYIGAIIDGASWEHELREDNNVFVKGLIGIGNRPDLVIRELSAPASVAPGQPLAVTVKTCNQGTQPSSPTLVQLFLSLDDELSSPSVGYPVRDQLELTGTSLPALGAGQCLTQVLSGPAMLPPDAQGDGRYFLGAIIDDSNQVHELREDNNSFAKTPIGVGLRSDLVVTALTSVPSVQVGASFSATVQVCNQGTQPSSASSVFLYTSLNAVLTAESPLSGGPNPQDQRLIGVAMVGAMNPGGCFSQSLTVSADLPPRAMGMPGAYFLGAYADAEEALSELREDNNSRVTGLLLTP